MAQLLEKMMDSYPLIQHSLQEVQASHQVVVVIPGRIRHRLADVAQVGKMHDPAGPILLDHSPLNRASSVRSTLSSGPHLDGRLVSTRETVDGYRMESLCRQGLADMTADVAGSTRNQNGSSLDHAFLATQAGSVSSVPEPLPPMTPVRNIQSENAGCRN